MTLTKHLGALVLSVVTPMDLSTLPEAQAQWHLNVPTQVAPQDLPASNRLRVVDVAPAPEIAGQRSPVVQAAPTACPIFLHAVIESEIASESFALIQRDGEPEVIREGGAIRVGSTRYVVRRIARQKLTLRKGKQQVPCFLSNEESSQ